MCGLILGTCSLIHAIGFCFNIQSMILLLTLSSIIRIPFEAIDVAVLTQVYPLTAYFRSSNIFCILNQNK